MPENEGGGEKSNHPIIEGNTHRDEQSWYNKPHAQLVDTLQGYIHQQEEVYKGAYSPEKIIQMRLALESHSPIQAKQDFFRSLKLAWDVLTYDRYEPGTPEERETGFDIDWTCNVGPEPPQIVKLSDPLQVRVIDALTEATGISHKKGQTEITIPDKLKDYSAYVLSGEYQERVAQAKANRKK